MANKRKKKTVSKPAPKQKNLKLRSLFHSAGLRLTRQRREIYQELESRHDHPDVDRLYRAVRPRVPKISLFTVYRTMNVLEAAGLVWRVATWKSHARYGAMLDAHAHFLCENCGRIDNVEVGDISGLNQRVAGQFGEVARVDMIFHGVGKCCAAAPVAVSP